LDPPRGRSDSGAGAASTHAGGNAANAMRADAPGASKRNKLAWHAGSTRSAASVAALQLAPWSSL